MLPPAVVAYVVYQTYLFCDNDLNVTGAVASFVMTVGQAIVVVMISWALFVACRAIAESIIASPKIAPESIDASLLRIAARIVGFFIAAWIIIRGVQGLGVDVLPLLAGLGVGGLAVALAAQRTFANFIGSIILFVNKPVRVGDYCRYGNQVGTVEQIGLISSRIRSRERTLITVPNAEFSEMKLENFAARDRMLIRTTINLRYETTPEQLRYVLAKLRELLLAHPMITPEPARARFVGFGPASLDVEIYAYARANEWSEFLKIREDLFLRVMDIVNGSGTSFAFPSQTLYLSRDQGLDGDKSAAAEAQVQRWREGRELPFPDFDAEFSERQRDTLDFPPQGSAVAGESVAPPGFRSVSRTAARPRARRAQRAPVSVRTAHGTPPHRIRRPRLSQRAVVPARGARRGPAAAVFPRRRHAGR